MSYNSGVIMLIISNRSRAMHSADLKLLAQLLPELYSTSPITITYLFTAKI